MNIYSCVALDAIILYIMSGQIASMIALKLSSLQNMANMKPT